MDLIQPERACGRTERFQKFLQEWCISRDFNVTRFQPERKGLRPDDKVFEEFGDIIREVEWVDQAELGPTRETFLLLLSLTIFFIISSEWDDKFSHTIQKALAIQQSDRHLIMLHTGEISSHKKIFRFENVWLAEATFKSFVQSA